ncbi:putative defense protein 3 [Myxocyprinus asiaticus]|uniref:putative defense protein 3 n=1 Tax=Myxocyprinus asiaticus TaxID=70543 RepID=UPI002221DD19|nr:putative defense protein 3 [Myxocyprinus asiaticus]
MMDAMILGVVLLQVLNCALSYPNGAPTSACVDMMPRHVGAQPQPSPAPYTIQTSSSTFQTGKPVTVAIKGPDYRGVLLEARSGSDVNAIGTWQTPPSNTKFLECAGNQQGAITHANTTIKNNSTIYTWIPPAPEKNIYFMATVAQQRTVYWLNVKSSTLTQSDGGGTIVLLNDRAETVTPAVMLLLAVLLANVQYLVE